jgi:uncharacterized membrane protein YsdA (DUF1294 family)
MKAIFVIIGYFLILNLLTFIMMGIDKRKAKKNLWRTPELNFFILSFLGGSLGALLGMYFFRHKTKHWYFRFGLPTILIIQVIGIVLLIASPIELVFM